MPEFRDVIPGSQVSVSQPSLAGLQAALAAGTLSSAALTGFYLQRRGRVNPALPAVITDNGEPRAGPPARLSAEPGDAFLVERLRQAGAVIIGKANLSEWANFRSMHSTSGWATLRGPAADPSAAV